MRLISWNINGRSEPWSELAQDETVDVALLQEAKPPPADADLEVVSGNDWSIAGWEKRTSCAVVARCSERVDVAPEPAIAPLGQATEHQLAVSRPGTIALAKITGAELAEPVIVVSAYAVWERPVPYRSQGWIYADASAHRVISDISALIAMQRGHRIIVAGDWNILHGYGENGSRYWGTRYQTVFDRMDALGLQFAGPQLPNGVPADPRPAELPESSADVPTYRRNVADASSAARQLDFVFISPELAPSCEVRALNNPDVWGPSDHCRVVIDVV